MQIILEIKELKDLEILLPLLRRLKISVVQPDPSLVNEPEKTPAKKPLSKFWGTIPSLDAKAFENYLQLSRSEWERPIS